MTQIEEAKQIQQALAKQVSTCDALSTSVQTIGGVDVSNRPFDPQQMIFGAAVLLRYPTLEVLETSTKAIKQTFPYIPGFLAFRETPVLLDAYKQLSYKPDILMVDGHGISHPKRLGVASHLGVLLDLPTIGVAKSILVGEPATTLPEEAGSTTPLLWKGETIGMMVRTKKRASPLIISPGHKISLETALQFVFSCLKGYRLPEPTRQAHLAANAFRKIAS